MELDEYRKELLEEIRVTASAQNESKSNMFVRTLCDYLVDLEIITSYEECFISIASAKDKRKTIALDAYAYDSVDKSLTLIAAIYNDSDSEVTLSKSEATKLFTKVENLMKEVFDNLLNKKFDMSTNQYDFINEFSSKKDDITKIKILIITDSVVSKMISKLENGNLNGIPVEYGIWDINRFYNVIGTGDYKENLEVDFKKYALNGIPLLYANNEGCEYKSYLGVIPAEVLANVYDEYGSRLLEGNVRSFLSVRGGVNKNIRRSILNEPEMFFAYNNGISATATNIELQYDGSIAYLVKAKDFQIVNGGQTTASLSTAKFKDKADLSKIYVQMKLTEVEGEDAVKIIPQISRCSNSQNKVNEADFFATSGFHIRMEQISRRLYAPSVGGNQYDTHWFYERARGQYLQEQLKMTLSQKKTFTNQNPKNQLITKTDLAKYINSWDGLPHTVSKGAQANFLAFANEVDPKWRENDEIYNEQYFKDTISKAILFKNIEKLVSNQPWYQNSYRANIVTYSIALFAYNIKNKLNECEFDFSKIWNNQKVPQDILEVFVEITKKVFDSITAPNRATMNVTQWCKKQICWEYIKEIEIDFGDGILKYLINRSEKRKKALEGKKEQRFMNEVEAQTKVISLGEVYWQKVLKFGKEKGLIDINDEKVLNVVVSMNSIRIPNNKQCKQLFDILDRLKDEGLVL
ncbi:AIPR family protein [Clostridium intestinale]|uniref:AIPR family protein n=1 Tax=Clostridium intestinale TaxID=36845 RepID=A0A7D6VV55_9CLOT|nr:AIPR family protein [Clostridium intestinale]QLY81797.1 AIPR family protein [Clostridium intestinale]